MVPVGDEIGLDAIILYPAESARTGRSCAISDGVGEREQRGGGLAEGPARPRAAPSPAARARWWRGRAKLLPCRRPYRNVERVREGERREEEEADVWGPCGSHAESVVISDKTGVKTVRGTKVTRKGSSEPVGKPSQVSDFPTGTTETNQQQKHSKIELGSTCFGCHLAIADDSDGGCGGEAGRWLGRDWPLAIGTSRCSSGAHQGETGCRWRGWEEIYRREEG
uniref:Uncharacterized protein n=1 Tax=Oryza rufipogon TaxID=4529 RepID=A0A0E0RBA7_ORYRU